ncbi:hypothetical protein [Streptomyces sp. CA-111067]|uniref:hypothetical protein n=1 Tax=Streptomyces sp. CA-111067 TaxID=3240046 RepID=UPI003D999852
MFRRGKTDDHARSQRLYESAQDLYDSSDDPDEFSYRVLGSMKAQLRREANRDDYPPKGHRYPRKAR